MSDRRHGATGGLPTAPERSTRSSSNWWSEHVASPRAIGGREVRAGNRELTRLVFAELLHVEVWIGLPS